MTKEFQQFVDPKDKMAFMDRVVEEYIDFMDNGVLYSPSARLLWLYDDENGTWVKRVMERRNNGIQMYTELYNFVKLHNIFENRFVNHGRLQQEVFKLIAFLENSGMIAPAHPEDRYHNFMDGIFDVTDGVMIEHTSNKKYFTDYQYPFTLGSDPDASLEEVSMPTDNQFTGDIKKLFDGAVEGDGELLLMLSQMFATSISPTRMQVMYVLIGPQHTAKSTFLNLLREFVGTKRSGVTSLQRFAGINANQFAFAKVVSGNKINISEEIKEEKLDSDVLKDVITAEYKEIERKGVDSEYVYFNTRFYGTSNNVISFSGGTEGINRRMKYIPLRRQIPTAEVDIDLIKKISNNADEMRQLFWFAYNGYLSIMKNKAKQDMYWFSGFFQNQDAIDAREEVEEVSRPSYGFFREVELKYVGGEGEDTPRVSSAVLREAYSNWAEEAGHGKSANMTQISFNKQVKEYLQSKFGVKHHIMKDILQRSGKKRERFFVGCDVDEDLLKEYDNSSGTW